MSVASCIATVRAACSAAALSSRVVNMRRRITFGRRVAIKASLDGSTIRSSVVGEPCRTTGAPTGSATLFVSDSEAESVIFPT